MEPGKPWRKIPAWFYDIRPISHEEVDRDDALMVYAGIQKYFGKNISKGAIDEFLFGDRIGGIKISSVQSMGSSETNIKGKLTLEATVILPSKNGGTIRHTFDKPEGKVSFDYIKEEKSTEKFPRSFGRAFFKQYIPLLRELGIKEIDIQASSVPSSGMNGGYTWCFYGFTNRNMHGTLHQYILYLEDYHGIVLDGKRRSAIMEIERMRMLVKEKLAKEFLLGIRRGNMEWSGYIPDIHNEGTVEMDELIRYLLRDK